MPRGHMVLFLGLYKPLPARRGNRWIRSRLEMARGELRRRWIGWETCALVVQHSVPLSWTALRCDESLKWCVLVLDEVQEVCLDDQGAISSNRW